MSKLSTPMQFHVKESPPPAYLDQTLEFTLFPLLPSELRLKIWDAVLREGRLIEIGLREGDYFDHFFTYARPPSAFHVCRESREQAVKKHTIITVPHTPNNGHHNGGIPWRGRTQAWYQAWQHKRTERGIHEPAPFRLLINNEVDILYLSINPSQSAENLWRWVGSHCIAGLEHFLFHLGSENSEGHKQLRRVALAGPYLPYPQEPYPLDYLTHLKTIHLIFEDTAEYLTNKNMALGILPKETMPDNSLWDENAGEFRRDINPKARYFRGAYGNDFCDVLKSVDIIPGTTWRR